MSAVRGALVENAVRRDIAGLRELMQSRSPGELLRIAGRESRYRASAARIALELGWAARRGDEILAGPFLGEPGFELLYWIPFLRRLLARHEVRPEQVTVLTRGGAAVWYADLAAHAIEIFDLIDPEEFRTRLAERHHRTSDQKQLTREPLDRELVALARERGAPRTVLHPLAMYTRLRWAWLGRQPLSDVLRHVEYGRLPRPPARSYLEGLPTEYIAVKAYFNDSFDDTSANREYVRRAVERIGRETNVVLLTSGDGVHDHVEWDEHVAGRIFRTRNLDARTNLAAQTAVIANARGFVCPYGGFSYIGAFLGVPTLAFTSHEGANPVHLAALREARLPNEFATVEVDDRDAVDAFLERRSTMVGAADVRG